MTISRGDRYYCSARRENGTCKADRGIGAAELEQRVLDGLRDIILEFTAEFKRELARLRKEGNASKGRLLKELQDVERGIKRCLDFITGGDGDPGSVRDQLRSLEARKRDIDADLTAQQDNVEIVIHPNLPELYRKKVGRLQQALQYETTRPRVGAWIAAYWPIPAASKEARTTATRFRDPLQRGHVRAGRSKNDVRRKRYQFRRVFARVSGITCPADIDAYVVSDGPAQPLQPVNECPDVRLSFRVVLE
jgi:hypothetical protein